MDFKELKDFMTSKDKSEKSVKYIEYTFANGKKSFLSFEELSDILKIDSVTLYEYYVKYNGNINLAVLAAENDESLEFSMKMIKRLLGITYIMEHNPNEIIENYNKLLKIKDSINRQIGNFCLLFQNSTEAKISISGDSLRLLMLRSSTNQVDSYFLSDKDFNSISDNTKNISDSHISKSNIEKKNIKVTSLDPEYASKEELSAMEGLIKIGNFAPELLTPEELVNIRRILPKYASTQVLSVLEDGLSEGLLVDSKVAKAIYDLFTKKKITISKNIEVFEELTKSKSLENEKAPEQGPILKLNK